MAIIFRTNDFGRLERVHNAMSVGIQTEESQRNLRFVRRPVIYVPSQYLLRCIEPLRSSGSCSETIDMTCSESLNEEMDSCDVFQVDMFDEREFQGQMLDTLFEVLEIQCNR